MAGLTAEEIQSFFDKLHDDPNYDSGFTIEEVGNGKGRIRLRFNKRFLRLGGTISGPSLMRLVDAAAYFTILGTLGPVFDAVTANLNINFLRRTPPGDVIAHVTLMKVGRKLAFADFRIDTDGPEPKTVAHGTCTYALPDSNKG